MSANQSGGATGGKTEDKSDKALDDALSKVKASSEYKVLSKKEYDDLVTLARQNMLTSTPQVTTVSDPVSQGAKPKFTFRNPLSTPSPVPRLQQILNASQGRNVSRMQQLLNATQGHNVTYIPQNFNFPKLPIFSGLEVPQKGEVTYEVWSLEVKCLRHIQELPEYSLLQSIRNSLRGSARDVIIPLGENATVDQILDKLEGFYGIVSTGATLMQTFYNDFQKESESIVTYGTRLEQTLSRAVTHGHIEIAAKDSILRSKFWTGLRSQQLKNSTRHLYDSKIDFKALLREIRKVDSEDASSSTPVQKQKAQQQSSQAETESKDDKILKQLSDLMDRMKSMERRLEDQQQASASSDNQSSFQRRSYQSQRGGYRNNNRGNFSRDGFSQGFGRGYQNSSGNSQNQNSRSSYKGGRSRGGYRGGTSGRGANRDGTSDRSEQPLNS